MLKFDIALLVSVFIYVITIVSNFESYSKAVQDWLVLLTHAFAIPMIVLLWKNTWIFITVVIGVGCSIAYHTSIAFDVGQNYTGPMDIAFSTLTLILITILVVFEKFPEWSLPFLLFSVLTLAIFWKNNIVHDIIGGTVILGQFIFVLKRTYDYWNNVADSRRSLRYLYISFGLGIGSVFAFLNHGSHSDPSYASIHSLWHVGAYSAMYFALRSIQTADYRVPRVTFDVNYENIFAYH